MAKIDLSGLGNSVNKALSTIVNKTGDKTVGNSTGTGPQVVGNIVPNKVAVNQGAATQQPPVVNPAGTTGGNAGAGIDSSTANKVQNSGTKNTVGSIINNLSGSTGIGDIINSLLNKGQGGAGNTAPGTTASSAESKAETAIGDLRNKYSQDLKDQFDYSAQKLKDERDAALRENWILQQQAEAALPEQMAAAGINGGASETTLANLRARYQGDRNDIQKGFSDDLGELAFEHGRQQAENENRYNERWLEYLLSLAEMEKRYEYEKNLQ